MRMGGLFMFEGTLLAVSLLSASASASELSNNTHAGVHVSMFEMSLFEPCDSDERWWLDAPGEINEPFWNRYLELRVEYERRSGEPLDSASPVFYLEAKGQVSEYGEHGHMGQYHRQFDITEFSEFRLATSEENRRCLTSGMLPLPDTRTE